MTRAQRMAFDAMLAALCVVLGFAAIRIGNVMKITLEDIPVLVGALLFGPVDGVLIAGIGLFLYQLLSYGITATTVLWILPFVVAGFLVGAYAKRHAFSNSDRQIAGILLVAELLITAINTLAIFADAKIYGYYYPTILTGMLALRILVAIGKGVLLGVLLPPVLKALSRFTKNGRRTG